MFYRPGLDAHGLPHDPFKALISPRPIGWISTLDTTGRANLAPYSFFNAVADKPPMLMFSSTGGKGATDEGKDTLANIRARGEFVHHVVPMAMSDAMNVSSGSYPSDVDEFDLAGLEKASCEIVSVPRIATALAAFECRLWQIIDLPAQASFLVLGEVVGIHIDPAILKDGMVDVTAYRPLSRLGYRDYAAVETVFALNRPGQA
ncbi:flavin reductase family protein [Amaricoccus macauensis]|uniref:flavin reductase family protein n=1 Tax=Amaricoccus macauensis TaxID=57001 RepID=UPI003C79A2DA